MITSRHITRTAEATGFRPEVVEKVLRLRGILERLDRHVTTRGAWVLKGGTALNLLHLDVPRLSVDIDLNFIGSEDVEKMRSARPDFERTLAAVCEREGCTIQRAPSEHAGGKFRMRFTSLLGGTQNLEVDVSYVARVPAPGDGKASRSLQVPPAQLDRKAVDRQLQPMLRGGSDGPNRSRDQLIAWIEAKLRPLAECLLTWSDAERRFLDRLLDDGVIEPENLHPDAAVQQRVREQPMLQWKAKNVRGHRHEET